MTVTAVDALLGNRGLVESMIGWEPVTRAARLVLWQGLNNELEVVVDKWGEQDLALQSLGFDPGVGQIELEPVLAENLHEGPHQSFLMSPLNRFPNVSVMAYLTSPAGSQLIDQGDTSDLTLFVDTMVKAGPVPDGLETEFETIVHRRIQRTTEAVNNVIRRDRTLLGTVLPQQLPPRGGIGQQAWVANINSGPTRYLWHGSRLQYTLQRISSFN